MKNITVLSLVVAALLFSACGDKTKDTANEAAKTTQETAADAEKAEAAAAAATERLAAEAEADAKKAADALKERAAETTDAAKTLAKEVSADNGAGEAAYAKCSGCHGKDGKTKALGKSEVIAGQSAADLEKKLQEYKAGKRDVAGMGTLMKGQVAQMSDEDIKAVSAYIGAM